MLGLGNTGAVDPSAGPVEGAVSRVLDSEICVRRDGIEYYRWQASRCRELAERQPNAEVKSQLLKVASEYDQLAQQAPQQR
jgi:hypothetical protein